jgi:polyhydroxybutyrate depolymerase
MSVVACTLLWSGTLAAASEQSVGQDRRGWIEINGERRAYRVHIPSAAAVGAPLPLVIALHGHGATSASMPKLTGLNALADREGFFVAYPEGSSWRGIPWRSWNAGRCCGYGVSRAVDDVAFIRELIDTLARSHAIDRQRVFVTGASNGAMMAHRLACELSDRIAAIAPVAGTPQVDACEPSEPVAVIAFHGTDDAYVPFEGGDGPMASDHRNDPPVREAMAAWGRRNRCEPTPFTMEDGDITKDLYNNCAGSVEVVLYTIKGGGHSWPGGRRGWMFGDRPTDQISATELMWRFFKQHAKQRE